MCLVFLSRDLSRLLSFYFIALWVRTNSHILATGLGLTGSDFTVVGPGSNDKND